MVFFLLFIGLSSGYHLVSGSVVDVKVQPGDDIVIFCDCSLSPGVLVVWYRNCSHQNQPTLVLKLRTKYMHSLRNDPLSWMTPLPRFQFVKNDSSNSYDLRISNITQSDEGFYFCGTQYPKLEDEGKYLEKRYIYAYGNITTQIILNSSEVAESHGTTFFFQPSHVSWFVLVPASAILLANICFILLYNECQKNDVRVHSRGYQVDARFSTTVVFGTMERKTL